ncbi:NTP transferase domain-containing protein [Actinocorallia sp. B10E7]|uniref:NTP transferase domain-containing protein n=1 Tax=Actinocorallia sp. B10E7 TaxID=3153558 RepID=UPI00325C6969
MLRIAAVLLATDEDAVALIDGERRVDRDVRALREGGCGPILVVTGAVPIEVLGGLIVPDPHWRDGPASGVRAGLAALPPHTTSAVLARTGAPGLTPGAVRRAIEEGARPPGDPGAPADLAFLDLSGLADRIP